MSGLGPYSRQGRVGAGSCGWAPPRLTWHTLVPSLALSSLNKHAEAVAYYKKALELDPENDTYKSNLKIAELKLREAPSPVSQSHERGMGRQRGMGRRLHPALGPHGAVWVIEELGTCSRDPSCLCDGDRYAGPRQGGGRGCPGVTVTGSLLGAPGRTLPEWCRAFETLRAGPVLYPEWPAWLQTPLTDASPSDGRRGQLGHRRPAE